MSGEGRTTAGDWKRAIERCREKLGPPVELDTSWFGRRPTERRHFATDCKGESFLGAAPSKCKLLLAQGRVVWGHPVKANADAYHDGRGDDLGVIVYGANESADGDVAALARLAEAVSDLRDQDPTDPDLIRLREVMLKDMRGSLAPQELPRQMTGGRTVVMADTQFHRRRLPIGRVIKSPLPLLILPEKTQANMILPLKYWSDELAEAWRLAAAEQAPSGTYDFVRIELVRQ
jgi:hypothetical protein